MLLRRFYYSAKPFLPWHVRLRLRRWLIRRKMEQVRDVWPIKEGSQCPPENWAGWPDGRKFAVVLTHDVEGQKGLDRIAALMDIEERLGFRSAFNLIPEGEYRVEKYLRDQIRGRGFEVGVHDLYHNGKLFHSRASFQAAAQKINHYLKDWNAGGFRSGFMHHNLDWIADLEVQYDESTFDTDPFEPQPEGVDTIFPFLCPRSNGKPFVELPYTLPQDSSLFLFGAEKDNRIWQTKLDWIARNGGMVLVNVHPDYLQMGGSRQSDEYPLAHYTELLEHLKAAYPGQYWLALPNELAAHAKKAGARVRQTNPKRVGMITHSFYESDNRVIRYAETLAKRGDTVDVYCLKKKRADKDEVLINGVRVHRLQIRAGKTEQTKMDYIVPILRFFFRSSWHVTVEHLRNPFNLLHIHNIPDFIVFAAWLPRLSNAGVILDIHDIVPEFFQNKFKTSTDSLFIKSLLLVEKLSAKFASHVIISNDLWREKYAARTGKNGQCSVFINNVDSNVFRPRPRERRDEKFIVLFPGSLNWHQGLDIAIKAFASVSREVPNSEFHIYGDGSVKPALQELTTNLGLGGVVKFFDPLPLADVARLMADADLGVVPKRADSFGNEAYSTKIMEFMSVGVPVVISRTRIDSYYFNDQVVRFFDSGDERQLADGIIDLARSSEKRQLLKANGNEYVQKNNWENRKAEYLQLVDSLVR